MSTEELKDILPEEKEKKMNLEELKKIIGTLLNNGQGEAVDQTLTSVQNQYPELYQEFMDIYQKK